MSRDEFEARCWIAVLIFDLIASIIIPGGPIGDVEAFAAGMMAAWDRERLARLMRIA